MSDEHEAKTEDELTKLQHECDQLRRHQAAEKASLHAALEQEKRIVEELTESRDAYANENEQWRQAYEGLEAAKIASDEQAAYDRQGLEEVIQNLNDKVSSLSEQLEQAANTLVGVENENQQIQARSNELERALNETTERLNGLSQSYDEMCALNNSLKEELAAAERTRLVIAKQHEQQMQQAEQDSEALKSTINAMKQDSEALKTTIKAKEQDTIVLKTNMEAQIKKIESELTVKEEENGHLRSQVEGLEAEIQRLRSLVTGDVMQNIERLEHQIYVKGEELVKIGEKMFQVDQSKAKIKTKYQELQNEVHSIRASLLKAVAGDDVDISAYKHIKLDELLRLRMRALEHEWTAAGNATSATPTKSQFDELEGNDEPYEQDFNSDTQETEVSLHLPSVDNFSAIDSLGCVGKLERELRVVRSRNKRQQIHIQRLEEELEVAGRGIAELQTMKAKMIEMVSRERVEKELRAKSDSTIKENGEKIAALTEHIEKLMVHLKHEAAAKTRAIDTNRRTEKELTECREKLAVTVKKNASREQQVQDLERGAQILEDQLRLMDEKFIDVRNKLDWTRATSQKENRKLENELRVLRMKWQMASDAGALNELPDWVTSSKTKPFGKKVLSKPLAQSRSEPKLLQAGRQAKDNNDEQSRLPSPNVHVEAIEKTAKMVRFNMPKIAQREQDANTPWSDSKLDALQQQLQAKRKL